MQGKRHDRVVEMRLCFFSGKVGDYKVPFKSTRKCRSTVEVFLDQINDYMTMWDLKESLKDDIKENGLRMYYRASNGGSTEKDNPSVKQLPVVNKQMLMLLKQMDISTDKAVKEGCDMDDAL